MILYPHHFIVNNILAYFILKHITFKRKGVQAVSIKEEIARLSSGVIAEYIEKIPSHIFDKIVEIRIRADKPVLIKTSKDILSVKTDCIPSMKDIGIMMEFLSRYSLYAFNEEIKKGFISISGGHRVGICGKTILDKGEVVDIRGVTSLNIRISHEIKGCGEKIMPYVMTKEEIKNTMIISPPACGKTTLLRDLVRLISDKGINVTVVDERNEICGGNGDYGLNTDILHSCPKVFGMKMALRSMAPQVIAVDEIGSMEDAKAIWEMVCCGITVICTIHGHSLDDIKKKYEIRELINKKIFDRFIFLQNKDNSIGNIKYVLNENFTRVSKE